MVYHQLLDGYSKRLHVSWALKYCYVVHNQSEANRILQASSLPKTNNHQKSFLVL